MEHVVIIQDLAGNAQSFRYKTDCADAAAFTVAAVVHLYRWLKDVLSGNRN
ncbi:hypothetical protein SDC9_171022 [bioreactor metagenome]|uniref:Uncharacterized protein n=1 Tax=bioreactor metagenome TaxID=1076179 RepID=A0A645GCX8_9ZZZZ